jgi:hypothetical protein
VERGHTGVVRDLLRLAAAHDARNHAENDVAMTLG